jgi:hypothetical protein
MYEMKWLKILLHRHSFDPKMWTLEAKIAKYDDNEVVVGHVEVYKNTCLTCGDIFTKRLAL